MVYFRLGFCYFYTYNYEEALNMFNKGISLNRANYDAYYYKGICERYLKYYEDSIMKFSYFLNCFVKNKSSLSKIIGQDQVSYAYYNKGKCLFYLGRYTEAIQMFTNYLKIKKNCYDVYFNRALCFYNSHKYKEAINDLSFIIKEMKDNEKFSNKKIQNKIWDNNDVCKNNEEDEDNKKYLFNDNTKELCIEVYLLKCKAYINLNKIESALKDINNFFELIEIEKNKIKQETEKESKTKLNRYKRKINNNNDDIDLKIEKLICKKYNICEALFKKGYCHMILLDYNIALEKFKKALKIDQSYIIVYFNMGLCHYNLNDKKEAIHDFNKVLESYLNDIEALINLVKCYREIGKI